MLKFRNGLLCSTAIDSGMGDVGGGNSIADVVGALDAADTATNDQGGGDAGADDEQDGGANDGDTGQDDGAGDDAGADDEHSDATGSDDEGGEAEQPGDADGEEGEKSAAEAIALEPPRWWNKEAKDQFKALTPALQAVVFAQEEMRERVVAKTKQESADARKASETLVQKLNHQLGVIEPLVNNGQAVFKSRWDGIDWAELAETLPPEQYQRARAHFERDTKALQQLTAAQSVLTQTAEAEYIKTEQSKLQTVAPDLADEKLGPQRKTALGNFLLGLGVTPPQLKMMSAVEASIAYDAMRWRQAQAKAANASTQKTPEQQQQRQKQKAKPNARPSAQPSGSINTNKRLASAQAAFDKDPSARNLQALMDAQG